jgi:flagella basal body P-ring formation protein FlgA
MLSFKKKWLFVITTIFSFSFILFSQSPTPSVTLNLTLKHQEIIEGRSDFFLEDVIEQTLPSSFKGIKLGTIEDNTVKITSEELLDKLSSIKGYNIIISGNYVLVSKLAENDEEEQPQKSNNRLPLECLKEHLESFIDRQQFKLEITVQSTQPKCNLNLEYDKIVWQLPKIKHGLRDIDKFRNLIVVLDGKKIKTQLDIKLHSWIYLSKVKLKKDDLLKENNFIKKYSDITLIDDIDGIITDFNLLGNYAYALKQDIGTGSILNMEHIRRLPDICTGEKLTAVTNSAGIELRIRVTAENDGFIDKQISVLTEDKKKINGYLRRLEPKGELYVEIH